MKLHEYQSKTILAGYGIPVPNSEVAITPDQAASATEMLGGKAVIKAQIYAGGRGKAGGIHIVDSPKDARITATSLLGTNLSTHQTGPLGAPVQKLLVEEPIKSISEFYVAIVIDNTFQSPVIIASKAGGMDIEEIANTDPNLIHREIIDPLIGFLPFQGRRLTNALTVEPALVRPITQIMGSLYQVFVDLDCSLVEINPLAATDSGTIIALDAKVTLDDSSLFRHLDLQELHDPDQEDPLELEASRIGVSYVRLEGDVGCLVNGAGLAMATMDVIRSVGARPANFLDVGGGISEEKMAQAVEITLSDPQVKRILVNIYGGILRCDIAAKGIVKAFKDNRASTPIVARIQGTNMDEGRAILEASGLNIVFASSLSDVIEAMAA